MSYVREQSIGEIVRGVFELYFKHFWTLSASSLFVMFPLLFINGILELKKLWVLLGIIYIPLILAIGFVYAAIIVIVSEVCLGNQPSVIRAYRRVFGQLTGKIIITTLLQLLFTIIGSILLIVPGIFALILLFFSPEVVVLEGISGMNALKRSNSLGKGYHWRTAIVLIVLLCVTALFVLIIFFILGIFIYLARTKSIIMVILVQDLIGSLITPIGLIAGVLMYYDLRVRKEAYDTTALAEDLKH